MALRIPCLECGGDGRYTIGRPNDPYAPEYVCETCEGEGSARCEASGCNEVAADAVVIGRDAIPMCERHFAEHQADAEA
jgi:DnaJ-class molecular chaperone